MQPTINQINLIKKYEEKFNVKFEGYTKEEADRFIRAYSGQKPLSPKQINLIFFCERMLEMSFNDGDIISYPNTYKRGSEFLEANLKKAIERWKDYHRGVPYAYEQIRELFEG